MLGISVQLSRRWGCRNLIPAVESPCRTPYQLRHMLLPLSPQPVEVCWSPAWVGLGLGSYRPFTKSNSQAQSSESRTSEGRGLGTERRKWTFKPNSSCMEMVVLPQKCPLWPCPGFPGPAQLFPQPCVSCFWPGVLSPPPLSTLHTSSRHTRPSRGNLCGSQQGSTS